MKLIDVRNVVFFLVVVAVYFFESYLVFSFSSKNTKQDNDLLVYMFISLRSTVYI